MSLLRHAAVDVLAVLIVGVDDVAELAGLLVVTLNQQLNGGKASTRGGIFVVFVHTHTTCCVDTRTNLKYDVVDCDVVVLETANLDYRQQARRRHTVQTLQTIIGKDAVFARQWHNVGCNTYHEQVQQMLNILEGDIMLLGISLHEFETHSATRQLIERIVAIGALWVENCYGRRNLLRRKMVVADNEIHALLSRINNLFYGLNTTVEGYRKRHAFTRGEVDTLNRDAVTVIITVGDVENKVLVTYLLQKLIDQRHGDYEQICSAIKNMIGNITGMVCDGAKVGCAMKVASGVSCALQSAVLAREGMCISEHDGIIEKDIEKTIQNLGRIGSVGMQNTDNMILDIMVCK